MSRKREVEDKTRNDIFATAIDHMKRTQGLHSQMELAQRMGINKDTITNIVNYRTKVTDDIVTKLQTASGCIFNLQWLRGKSDIMLAEDLLEQSDSIQKEETEKEGLPETSNLINAWIAAKDETIAAKDETIEALRQKVVAKDETIEALRGRLADKEELLENERSKVKKLQQQLCQIHIEREIQSGHTPIGAAEPDPMQPIL